MNNVSPEEKQKSRLSKPVLVSGFVIIVAFIAWASVQIVGFVPNAFSSLASLAQGISSYRESLSPENDTPLLVSSDYAAADVGMPVTINWTSDSREGTYAFLYSCIDGVSIDIVDTEGLRSLACDTRYSLGTATTLTIIVNSEKERQVEVPYFVSFMRPNDSGPIRTGEQALAITNKAIEDTLASNEQAGEVLGEETPAVTETETPAPTPTTPKPVVVAEPVTEYTYQIPVSNPNGYTDLATRFLAVGDIVNGKFVARSIERDGKGAFQFEVKNIGTKTSGTWTYSVTLPDGDTYTSPKQTALKPNERAIISLGFDTPNKASHTFVVVVKVEDKVASNNSFKRAVNFTK